MQPIIFVDLDGVLVDLWAGLEERLNKKIPFDNKKLFTEEFYKFIETLTPAELTQFWVKLPPTADCFRIWNAVKPYKALILTSVTNHQSSIYGKEIWCKNNLNIFSDRIYCSAKSTDKKNYASKNSILIDDFIDNVVEWREAGGIAIHHQDADDTIRQIKDYISKLWKYDVY